MIRKLGRQSDGKNTLERVALKITGEDGKNLGYYKFGVNPENYMETHPQRTTVMKTRSSAIVEDYGPDIMQISFSGSTGFKTDSEGHSGAYRLATLVGMLEEYALIGHRADETQRQSAELFFYNFTSGGSYAVHIAPEGFQVSRSVNKPLLSEYQINLLVLRNANDPNIRDIQDAEIGNSFYETTTKALNPNSKTANYYTALNGLAQEMR